MLEQLTDRFEKFVRNLRGQGKLTEKNVQDTVRQVRRIMLEADVSLPAAKAFVKTIQEKSLGQDVLKSITPGQQMVKIIHDELAAFLGGQAEPIRFGKSPSTILMVGLNGAGKTTTCAKLALHLKRSGRQPLLVAADTKRPAAIEQLVLLGKQLDIPVFTSDDKNPVRIAKDARKHAQKESLDCIIIDSAGRMHVDGELMDELKRLQSIANPPETLLVVDGMTGQDAVRSAKAFSERIDITGLILTKLDGDARGGAALSIRWITDKPIKFVGVGEKPADLDAFHPDRMAGRILGMGDIVSLVEKAQSTVDAEQAAKLAQKVAKQELTLEDFREQLIQLKNMGPIDSLLQMIPGMRGALKGMQVDESEFTGVTAIIDSMTVKERQIPRIIDGSRRRRIARGSGRSVQDVNRLLNQFDQMRKMLKRMGKRGGKMPLGLPGMPGLGGR
ncbi:MAG: signal recognition particle protein [Candidatus Hatepunaea meridiana]|nr:signal recognition particle protein [Candidatus Hatepunaea meridiana]